MPAFTLVEVLVVIVMIAVLASMSMLALSKAKQSAGAAVDANDMRQISSAVVMYASDHNDYLPTSSGGVSPTFSVKGYDICSKLCVYFGYENPKDGQFIPEFAASSWQTPANATTGPSMLTCVPAYAGTGRPSSITNPEEPFIRPMGYALNPKRDSMTLSAAMAIMTDPSRSLICYEIDRQLPKLGKPGWLSLVPEKMAHGSYRLGLYWDGHVGKFDINMNPM